MWHRLTETCPIFDWNPNMCNCKKQISHTRIKYFAHSMLGLSSLSIFSFRIFPSYSGPVTVLLLRVRVVQGPFLLSYLDGRQHRGPEATIKLPSEVLPLICGFESSRCCLSSPFRKNPEIFLQIFLPLEFFYPTQGRSRSWSFASGPFRAPSPYPISMISIELRREQ